MSGWVHELFLIMLDGASLSTEMLSTTPTSYINRPWAQIISGTTNINKRFHRTSLLSITLHLHTNQRRQAVNRQEHPGYGHFLCLPTSTSKSVNLLAFESPFCSLLSRSFSKLPQAIRCSSATIVGTDAAAARPTATSVSALSLTTGVRC